MPPRRPWHLGFLPHPTTPLQKQPDSPSSPRSPLSPVRPRSTSPTLPKSACLPSSSSSTPPQLAPPRCPHLRSLIPSPPLSPQVVTDAPAKPCPWVWRCHLCNRQYASGVTRRCLEDGYYFCSLPSPAPSPGIEFEDPPESIEDFDGAELEMGRFERTEGMTVGEAVIEKVRSIRQKGRRTKSKKRMKMVKRCRAEFDYAGWSRYNYWQREVRTSQLTRRGDGEGRTKGRGGYGESPADQRERWQSDMKKDRRRDCDFPSACHNQRQAERERIARSRTSQLKQERLYVQKVHQQKAVQQTSIELGLGEQWKDDWELRMNGSGPQINLTFSTTTEVERDSQLLLDLSASDTASALSGIGASGDIGFSIIMEGMGPLGLDCDGLGHRGYQFEYTTSRRKSMDTEDQPNSPLRSEFHLDSEDRDAEATENITPDSGCDV